MAHDRQFRFGVIVPQARARRKEFTELARQAEALGYSTLFVPDHFVDHPLAPIAGAGARPPRSPTRCASARSCSATTTSTRSCSRSEAATLDLLSDGRLELGIGAGWMTVDYEKAGIPLDRPGVRIARLAESIAILKGLFADGPFTFHGEHYRVDRPRRAAQAGAAAAPAVRDRRRRAEDPRARGARGADRRHQRQPARPATATTRRRAPTRCTPARDRREARVAARRRGRRASTTSRSRRSSGSCTSPTTARGIAEAMAPAFGVTPDDALDAPVTLVGTESTRSSTLLERRRERWQMSLHRRAATSPSTQFAPVVARLAGT